MEELKLISETKDENEKVEKYIFGENGSIECHFPRNSDPEERQRAINGGAKILLQGYIRDLKKEKAGA